MNLFKISIANIKEKKLNSFLSVLLLTLGIGMISLLLLLNKQLTNSSEKIFGVLIWSLAQREVLCN